MNEPHLDVAGYALDALTDDERAAFETHLANCAECQARLREFTETTAQLSAETETPPPDQLRTDVLAAIAETPQHRPEPAADHQRGPDRPDGHDGDRADAGTKPGENTALSPDVRPGSTPARWTTRTRWRRIGQIAVAAAVAIVLAVGGWAVGRQQFAQSQQAESTAQSRLLSASDAKIYRQPMPNGASVSYVVSQKQNAAMAIVSGNPEPGSGRTFQLWTMHGAKVDKAEPDRTFSGSESKPVWLKGNVSAAAALAITVEPDGGSQQPTTDAFAIQKL